MSCSKNTYDCGLFGLGTLLHVLVGIQIDQDIFSQVDITLMRTSLYSIFEANEAFDKDPKEHLSRAAIVYFFLHFAMVKSSAFKKTNT